MSVHKENPRGSFCWIELATSDQSAGKKFYGDLFGWTVDDMPMGPGEFYSMFHLHGEPVAAGYTLRSEQRDQGIPPHWQVYIKVENADKAVSRALEAGGKVLMGAFDVYDAGRMAVLQDPGGAVFCVWETKNSDGISVRNEEGAFCWADLVTPDVDKASTFYKKMFGWEMVGDDDDQPHSGYMHIKNGDEHIGGVPPAAHRDPRTPPNWMIYFQTANCDATAAKAKQLGAKFRLEPMTMENVGRMAVLADPQGAVFAIFQSMRKA